MDYVKKVAMILIATLFVLQLPQVAKADDQSDLLNKVGNAVILYLGSPNAIVNLSDKMIDEDNFSIVPYTNKGSTLVPLRFIGESLGAIVKWDNASSTVTLQSNNRTIK